MSDVPPNAGDDADEPIEDDDNPTADATAGSADDAGNAGDGPAAAGSDGPDGEADEEVVLSDELTAIGIVEPVEIQHEMEQSFLDYAMSVIVSRALPDVRDGLKPVHRRILWGMYDQGVRPDRSHVKCARVVGDVMGKYHPHGDSAIYDAMVRLGQTFSLRHPLIDPHGNFGSPSDGPAAMRYTEARLSKLAMHMLDGIDQETVDFVDNFDGQEEEPTVLPSRFPNFLVNGGQGIAVGMATNVPPHNLGEVIDATIHLLRNPEATNEDLMEHVLGPDFPTAGLILGRTGIRDAYTTGRGSIRIRGRAEIVEGKTGDQIIVTEIPYQTSVEQIEQKAAELVNRRELEGIRAIRNESAQGEIRLVFELKRDAPALVILNNLYKYTPLQGTFSVNMVALVDGVPRTLDLQSALAAYIDHQVEVVTRRTEFLLDKAQKRAHIVEGLLKALDMIDRIIAAIRSSEDRPDARSKLMSDDFGFSEIQANHILDLPLGRLTRLGKAELTEELEELTKNITYYESLLADDAKLRGVISDEMLEIRDEYATPRMSELTYDPGSLDIEDLIDDEELVVTMSSKGYIKTTSIDAFRSQGRGGRGISGAKLRDEDYVEHMIYTSAHAYLLFFSNRGRVYRVKAHEIPQQERTARGIAIVNLLQLQPEETIQAVVDTRDYETNRFLMFATKQGQVKKTQFTAYDSSLKAGLIAINLRDGDELVRVIPTNGDDDIFLSTYKGQVMRFSESTVRPMGRSAAGVRGIRVREGDHVVSCAVARDDAMFLLVTEQGYGKRTPIDEFTAKGRGGQGVRGIKVVEGRGGLAGARMVTDDEDVILIGTGGVIMRTRVSEISTQGRSATGVRIMNVNEGQSVAAITPAPAGEEEELDEDGNVIVPEAATEQELDEDGNVIVPVATDGVEAADDGDIDLTAATSDEDDSASEDDDE